MSSKRLASALKRDGSPGNTTLATGSALIASEGVKVDKGGSDGAGGAVGGAAQPVSKASKPAASARCQRARPKTWPAIKPGSGGE
ncbi:MAG: hypothetical protein NTZ64_01620 [Polaromonas sp.]|nr:hypothetical protein [Polaromonas sp.]